MKCVSALAGVVHSLLSLAALAGEGGVPMLGNPIETDPNSGAEIYLLGGDERPADNIYGEQPYGDPTGRWIAVRYYPRKPKPGGISFIDLQDGSRRDVLVGKPPFPAFHAWGEYLYYHQKVDGKLMLRRCKYATFETEDIAQLPTEMGRFSYGTVSPDHRYYAVSVAGKKGEPSKVHLLDLQTNKWRLLLDKPGYHAKHEQFSRDGRNRVLIQLNQMPDVKQVLLGEIAVDGTTTMFPADQPHTPRPTGHECWVGTSASVFFSTGTVKGQPSNIWTGKVGDPGPVSIPAPKQRAGHISVSRCGRYWIVDTGEDGIPIYIGSFASGKSRRAVFSRTVYDGKQWAHAHPYLTADNKWLIFAARREGERAQVYGAKLATGWLEDI